MGGEALPRRGPPHRPLSSSVPLRPGHGRRTEETKREATHLVRWAVPVGGPMTTTHRGEAEKAPRGGGRLQTGLRSSSGLRPLSSAALVRPTAASLAAVPSLRFRLPQQVLFHAQPSPTEPLFRPTDRPFPFWDLVLRTPPPLSCRRFFSALPKPPDASRFCSSEAPRRAKHPRSSKLRNEEAQAA